MTKHDIIHKLSKVWCILFKAREMSTHAQTIDRLNESMGIIYDTTQKMCPDIARLKKTMEELSKKGEEDGKNNYMDCC